MGDMDTYTLPSMKRRREEVLQRLERVAKAQKLVDDYDMDMRKDATTLIAAVWRGHVVRKANPSGDAAIAAEFDTIDDDALLTLEIPTPTPVPVPVFVRYMPPAYSFDRNAARIAALGRAHATALATIEEHAGYIEEFPSLPNYRIAEYLCGKHLHYNDRFTVIGFLTMNRVAPVLVAELMVAAGQLHDQQSVEHVVSMVKRMRQGTFHRYKAYCMETKQWESMLPPRENNGNWDLEGADWEAALTYLRGVLPRFFRTRRCYG